MSEPFEPLMRARAAAARLDVADELLGALNAYLALLSRWNRKINLTAFDLDLPSEAAIDRLIIEPLGAARLVRATDQCSIDIGSGGGSPAIPLRLACPHLEMVLVEVRERKASFLREVTRELGLTNVRVACEPFQEFATRSEWSGRADLLTMRAVRPDREIWQSARAVSTAGARFLWFHEIGETTNYDEWWAASSGSPTGDVAVLSAK